MLELLQVSENSPVLCSTIGMEISGFLEQIYARLSADSPSDQTLTLLSSIPRSSLYPRDNMHKRSICHRSVCLSVRLSVFHDQVLYRNGLTYRRNS